MARGFVDRVLTFMGIQDAPVAEEPVPAPERVAKAEEAADEGSLKAGARRARFRRAGAWEGAEEEDGRAGLRGTASEAGRARTDMTVVVVKPRVFDEVEHIAATLRERRPVVVSLEGCGRDVAQRIIDFVSGATYALDGNMKRLADDIFLFTPSGVGIDEAAAAHEGRQNDGAAAEEGGRP